MNLIQFLKKVDALAEKMAKEQLKEFIHELARTLPENKRNDFWKMMQCTEKEICTGQEETLKKRPEGPDLQSDIEQIMAVLEEINGKERCLDSEYNEEWDEWYNSDAEEILFTDPHGLLLDIEKGIELIHKCVDEEAYQDGCELAELLSVLEVSAEGDYLDYDGSPLGVGELYEYELLHGSFERVVRESLFLSYMGNELAARAEELYRMMGNYGCYSVKLEEIMQMGNHDLLEVEKFLPKWIEYLGSRMDSGAGILLLEAQTMVGDEKQLLDTARRFADKHPELYKQILERGKESGKDEEMLRIGIEALDKLPASYLIRSEIALLSACYACKNKDSSRAEFCWLEAFRSDTSVVNYMRIKILARNRYDEQVKQIYKELHGQMKRKHDEISGYYMTNVQRKNSLSHNVYCAILFFEKDFENVIKVGMSEKSPLGWSFTFMKEGLAMFLLLLFEGESLMSGINAMLEMVVSGYEFTSAKFVLGTDISEKNNREQFWELFCSWKAEVSFTEEESEEWLKMIDRLISMRTVGIMDANRRNYYGECAAYIAAYGEVLESRGMKGGKAKLMEKYRAEYSRRRAFHQELRNFGMR